MPFGPNSGYSGVGPANLAVTGGHTIRLSGSAAVISTLPSTNSTLATTSELSSYLPRSGGTLAGGLTISNGNLTLTGPTNPMSDPNIVGYIQIEVDGERLGSLTAGEI